MLRWWVLGLLLCNVIYFFWQRQAIPLDRIPEPLAAVQGAPLTLLNEAPKDKPEAAPADPARQSGQSTVGADDNSPADAQSPQSVPVCHMIGPFKEKISARQVKERLAALDITVNTYSLSIPGKPDYWVHLGPMRSRKEAMDALRELHSKNIDSFLITEGSLLNGISLGFYTRVELAQAVLKQRREQGYDAKIQEVPRFSEELWEVFADGQYSKFSDATWDEVRAGTQDIELRKNFCDAIASAEKLD